jgi:hypothetical protein
MPATNRTQPQQIGDNIAARVEGRTLIIEINLDQDFGPSSNGKSNTIASSRGSAAVAGTDCGVLVLNFYHPTRTAARSRHGQSSYQQPPPDPEEVGFVVCQLLIALSTYDELGAEVCRRYALTRLPQLWDVLPGPYSA